MEKVREAGKRRGSIIVPPPPAGPEGLDAMGLPKLSVDVSFAKDFEGMVDWYLGREREGLVSCTVGGGYAAAYGAENLSPFLR